MEKDTVFCINCGCKQKYIVKSQIDSLNVRNVEFTYIEKTAHCSKCENEVYVPEINDYNCTARETAYFLKTKNINN